MLSECVSVFRYETNSLHENFPFNYLPDELKEDEDRLQSKKIEEVKVLKTDEY
jgi:hypothetical protein